MSDTRACVLTPPGSGAIAVLAVCGPRAWPVIRTLFRTSAGRALPAEGLKTSMWFGYIREQAADEVILVTHAPDHFEIHTHGGRQVVGWLLDLLRARGIEGGTQPTGPAHGFVDPAAAALLPFARTTRTAAILLDQAQGAYLRALREIEAGGAAAAELAARLRRNARVGGHLVEAWRVAVAGAPNAGKSSLLNALAGFDRTVVSPVPGTTRDAVAVSLALGGWPVDLTDTAGLRDAPDALEREGVGRARAAVAESDLILWVVDATGPRPGSVRDVAEAVGVPTDRLVVVFNKTDLADVPVEEVPEAARVSARTGAGVTELAARIAAALVPEPPAPGEPVPYTPELSARWS
jgi:tRNA modification GTPase